MLACHYCGKGLEARGPLRKTRDHKIPLCRGGENCAANRVPCCIRCNHLKGPLTDEEFRSLRRDEKLLKEFRRAVLQKISEAAITNPRGVIHA